MKLPITGMLGNVVFLGHTALIKKGLKENNSNNEYKISKRT